MNVEKLLMPEMRKSIYILGGGTMSHICSHLAFCAPAFGGTARLIKRLIESEKLAPHMDIELQLTKMAEASGDVEPWREINTNEDVSEYVEKYLKQDLTAKIVFFTIALCDYKPNKMWTNIDIKSEVNFGKDQERIETNLVPTLNLSCIPEKKIISSVRQGRKDIFLVGFKLTHNKTKQEMFIRGLKLLKDSSCNLVMVNDLGTGMNMIVTPEETTYAETSVRDEALRQLIQMAVVRSQLTFTQSTVVDGKLIAWESPEVPTTLRRIVNWCIEQGAYKPFNGATVGHFACKLGETEFLTSIRKSNFNDLAKNGLVRIKTNGPDTVLAYGAKPSVGGQSQRIVFKDHPGLDCIVHFHCPLKANPRDQIPVRSQKEYECGSHECGKNTSDGLKAFGNIWAVMLDNHGPNLVFSRATCPDEVIDFIKANFDLEKKTGGYKLS